MPNADLGMVDQYHAKACHCIINRRNIVGKDNQTRQYFNAWSTACIENPNNSQKIYQCFVTDDFYSKCKNYFSASVEGLI